MLCRTQANHAVKHRAASDSKCIMIRTLESRRACNPIPGTPCHAMRHAMPCHVISTHATIQRTRRSDSIPLAGITPRDRDPAGFHRATEWRTPRAWPPPTGSAWGSPWTYPPWDPHGAPPEVPMGRPAHGASPRPNNYACPPAEGLLPTPKTPRQPREVEMHTSLVAMAPER